MLALRFELQLIELSLSMFNDEFHSFRFPSIFGSNDLSIAIFSKST